MNTNTGVQKMTKLEKAQEHLDRGVFYSKSDLKDACGYLNDVLFDEIVCNKSVQATDKFQNFVEKNIQNGTFEVISKEGCYDIIKYTKKISFIKTGWGKWIFDLPYTVHHLRNEHIEVAKIADENLAQKLIDLIEMRKTFKSFEIIQRPKKNSLDQKVKKAITNWLDKAEQDEAKALKLSEIFGDLAITTNVHRVWYWGNKSYIRTFWYVNNELTKFAVIQQAYIEALDKGIIKECA